MKTHIQIEFIEFSLGRVKLSNILQDGSNNRGQTIEARDKTRGIIIY